MAPRCSFIPPYVLDRIANSPGVTEETRNAAIETQRVSDTVREERTENFNSLFATPGPQRPEVQPHPPKFRQVFNKKTTNAPARSEGQQKVEDRHVNDCYEGLGIVYDFFSNVFGRNSMDNAGSPLIGVVHYMENLNNAFFDGRQVLFGDGDGVSFNHFTSSRIIIAHELTHWLTASTAKLVYSNQSGALNESMSDVFACIVEQHYLDQDVNSTDWTIGHRLIPVASRAHALRSMKAPGTAYKDDPVLGKDPQPWHMNYYDHGSGDNGGVHTNSGIPNHAFYLAAIGIGGKSWEQAGHIWYNTLTDPSISPNCTFAQFAHLTVEHARPYSDRTRKAVEDAWSRVGVLGTNVPPSQAPPSTPNPQTPVPPNTSHTSLPAISCKKCGVRNIGARIHALCLVCSGGSYSLCRKCYIVSPHCLDRSHTLRTQKYSSSGMDSSIWTLQTGKFCDYCNSLISDGAYSCNSCSLGNKESCANCVRRRTGCPHAR